jgi:hypothetical protein
VVREGQSGEPGPDRQVHELLGTVATVRDVGMSVEVDHVVNVNRRV